MNELWAVVMWDAELETWDRNVFLHKDDAIKGMVNWMIDQFTTWGLSYTTRLNDELELELVNDDAKVLGVVRRNTATLDVGSRKNIEWYMFRVN